MANRKRILNKTDMIDLSFTSLIELTVTNYFKKKRLIINSRSKFKKDTIIQILYFQIEEYTLGKKAKKIRDLIISRKKYEEYYKKLTSVKINNIIPSVDRLFVGVKIELEIERGNSKISFKWIFGTQEKRWKDLDSVVSFILEVCGEKRILTHRISEKLPASI